MQHARCTRRHSLKARRGFASLRCLECASKRRPIAYQPYRTQYRAICRTCRLRNSLTRPLGIGLWHPHLLKDYGRTWLFSDVTPFRCALYLKLLAKQVKRDPITQLRACTSTLLGSKACRRRCCCQALVDLLACRCEPPSPQLRRRPPSPVYDPDEQWQLDLASRVQARQVAPGLRRVGPASPEHARPLRLSGLCDGADYLRPASRHVASARTRA